jgi:amidophosphoribosyltransferase
MSPDPKNPVNLVNPVKTRFEKIFLGHLRYATFGKNDVAFCHPFVHESSELNHTLLLAGNFNLTNAHELFDDYRHHGSFPTSKSDGYLICEMIAHALKNISRVEHAEHVELEPNLHDSTCAAWSESALSRAISTALKNADGAWTLCGMTADGWAFATRDPHGIRPGWHYIDDEVVVVASERAAIQAAFDVPPEAVKELPPGEALVVSPEGKVEFCELDNRPAAGDSVTTKLPNHQTTKPIPRPCSFERIYFSRANDADIHRERKALGAALVPRILEQANAPMDRIFFSYIPNSARIAFHGLLEELFRIVVADQRQLGGAVVKWCGSSSAQPPNHQTTKPLNCFPRFGEVAVKDAKFRTFIADAAARREFYKHVYDVTYGLVKKDDTLVVLDDSIVRGNTMKNAILPMLDRLGPKRIVIASSAPPIRYPDCYGIDMSTLGELVAFRALVNLLDGERGTYPPSEASAEGGSMRGGNGERELREALAESEHLHDSTCSTRLKSLNPLASLYARFTEKQHAAEIARLLTPPGMKAEVVVVYQTVENLRQCLSQPPNHSTTKLPNHSIGDWYFTGDYPTPGGYKVLRKALLNYLDKNSERSY